MRSTSAVIALLYLLLIVAWAGSATHAFAADDVQSPDVLAPANEPAPLPTIELNEFIVVPAVGHYGRLPVHRDVVELQLVTGIWQPPEAGEPINIGAGQTKTWRSAAAANGALEARTIRGGYAFTKFNSPVERVMLLEAAGHAAVYVNGDVRTGDPYSLGWLRLPVLVRKGENTLLFHVAADQLTARLTTPPAEVFLLEADHTLPTLIRGEQESVWGAIPVVNASRTWLRNAKLVCDAASGGTASTDVPPIAPLSVAKIPFEIPRAAKETGSAIQYDLRLLRQEVNSSAVTKISLPLVGPDDIQVRTFRSGIDNSVQPYAARPTSAPVASASTSSANLSGTVLTLHSAALDCAAQAARYEPKSWAHVVAPQGRRPFGFDWEDWGRIDFLEAAADAAKHYVANPRRTYLTGQSMGGHGVWHLGVTYPDMFAAIGPSAAWASFWSYGGGMPTFQNPSPLEALLLRSYSTSDTVQLLGNLVDTGVYVLHSGNDESVPVAQARFMRSRLASFHTNFAYHEIGDDKSGEPACDWPPMMEFFERLERPQAGERKIIDFATANPGVSSRSDWLTIEAQQQQLAISRAVLKQDIDTRTFVGQTTNVARLSIDVSHLPPGKPIDVALDGQQLEAPWPEDTHRLWFARTENQWQSTGPPAPRTKGPARNGPFKSAFDHDAILVYGTGGTAEEDRWAEAKARYDAETFWYRGNGHLEIMPDSEFDPTRTVDRNVILYGNADTNSAWTRLLADCPVQVHRSEVRVGDRTEPGDDLAVLAIYPRSDSDSASVGIVAGTGPVGMAITNRLRYFVSGIAYPDLMIVDADALLDGVSAVRAWGYFGPDWTTDGADIAWRDGP